MSSMAVQTNVMAINSHRSLGLVGNAQSRASARLSSGFRINSAADDAAGLAISEKMRAQIRGLDQASRNGQDGVSLIQTAEGAMSIVNDMVIRIRELVVQAANDTNAHDGGNLAQSDRIQIQREINALMDEINDITERTEFNTRTLLNGDLAKTALPGTPGETPPTGTDPVSTVARDVFAMVIPDTHTALVAALATSFDGGAASAVTGDNLFAFVADGLGGATGLTEAQLTAVGLAAAGGDLAMANAGIANAFNVAIAMLVGSELLPNGAVDAADLGYQVNHWLAGRNALGIELNAWVGNEVQTLEGLFYRGATPALGATEAEIKVGQLQNLVIDALLSVDLGTYLVAATAPPGFNPTVDGGGTVEAHHTWYVTDGGNIGIHGDNVVDAAAARAAAVQAFNSFLSTHGGLGAMNDSNLFTVDEFLEWANEETDAMGGMMGISGTGMYDDLDFDLHEFLTGTLWQGAFTEAMGAAMFEETGADHFDVALREALAAAGYLNNSGATATWTAAAMAHTGGLTFTVRQEMVGYGGEEDSQTGQYRYVTVNFAAGSLASGGAADTAFTVVGGDLAVVTAMEGLSDFGVIFRDELIRAIDTAIAESQLPPEADPDAPPEPGNALWFHIGANSNQGIQLNIAAVNVEALSAVGTGDTDLTVSTQTLRHAVEFGRSFANLRNDDLDDGYGIMLERGEYINQFIDAIDAALAHVAGERANLGATQNRLEFTIENLDIASENLSAANSRIRDADMAAEMMRFTQSNVLQQAAISMLAQANQAPQSILQLLR